MYRWLIIGCLVLSACGSMVEEKEALKALEEAGYTKAECTSSNWVTPYWAGCSKDDDVAFKCTAENYAGKRVKVTVCSNFMFKSSTIRH